MNMRIPWTGLPGLAALWCALALGASAGGRVGGDAEIVYERVGPGGAAYAASGVVKLGGTASQNFMPYLATNAAGGACLNGFWKAEDACTLYNPSITEIVQETNQVAITFLVVNDNAYSVEYIDIEAGGLTNGVQWITNEVATLTGVGGAGATTTVWHDVSGSTNRAKFYVIRCQ